MRRCFPSGGPTSQLPGGCYLPFCCLSTELTHSLSLLNLGFANFAQPPFMQSSLLAGALSVLGLALGGDPSGLLGAGVLEPLPVAPLSELGLVLWLGL
jgi:hypothetical protein